MRTDEGDIPMIHGMMIKCVLLILVLCIVGYFFAPEAKATFFKELGLLAFAFLSGKFTNGFGLRPGPRRRSSDE